jgi:hypothetical protein
MGTLSSPPADIFTLQGTSAVATVVRPSEDAFAVQKLRENTNTKKATDIDWRMVFIDFPFFTNSFYADPWGKNYV